MIQTGGFLCADLKVNLKSLLTVSSSFWQWYWKDTLEIVIIIVALILHSPTVSKDVTSFPDVCSSSSGIWLGEVNVFCGLVMFKTTLFAVHVDLTENRWKLWQAVTNVYSSHFSLSLFCNWWSQVQSVWTRKVPDWSLSNWGDTSETKDPQTEKYVHHFTNINPVVISLHNHNWPHTDNVWNKISHRDVFRCLSLTLYFPSEETKRSSSKSSHLRNWN